MNPRVRRLAIFALRVLAVIPRFAGPWRLVQENHVLRAAIKTASDDMIRIIASRAPDPRALNRAAMTSIPLKTIVNQAAIAVEKKKPREWHPAPQPVISIVLSTYQQLAALQETIDSIRKSGIQVPHEIIVIDGGSQDGTSEWLIKQPDILTIVNHRREGLLDIAARVAHGRVELVALCKCPPQHIEGERLSPRKA